MTMGLATAMPFYSRRFGGGVGGLGDPSLIWEWDAASLNFVPAVGTGTPTFSRAGTGTFIDSNGFLQTAAVDVPRFTYDPVTLALRGFYAEPGAANVCLHNRDLANAAWVATNATPVKNQTGIDNVGNSASQLVALVANATLIQTTVSASAPRRTSAYIKRLVGTGTIEMTVDGGATWTNVDAQVAVVDAPLGFARVFLPIQTLANAAPGFRLGTSGDSIAVDFVQVESNFMSSPIETTTVAVTRAADNCSLDTTLIAGFNAAAFTMYSEHFVNPAVAATGNNASFHLGDGSGTNTCELATRPSAAMRASCTTAGVLQAFNDVAAGATFHKCAAAFEINNFFSACNGINGSQDSVLTMPAVPLLGVGGRGICTLYEAVRRLRLYNVRKSNAEILALST